ncbi:MAG: F0F1 ATP synthase subunit A [Lachnospiraceae bacterium]|jgi:F-type H+-transporting ATPase subunit a|nr:F0F1 ATP synthase subunit A [Lachnospiraceae bacterium]
MERIAEELMAQLNADTAFTIRLGGLEIPVAESTVISWVVIGIVLILCLILTADLKVKNISKRQALAELIVTKLQGMVEGMIGEEGKEYIPYLVSVLIFIGFSNIIGIFGMKPPTKDMNVTAGLAIMSIVLVQIASIRKKRVKGWLKSFAQPMAVVAPINILELVIKPLSLCMRLFGNVVGAFVIMELLKTVVPILVPTVFSLYFDLFDGLLQAYVFVFLTSMYIREAVE